MNRTEQAQKAEVMALAMTRQVASEVREPGWFDNFAPPIAPADAQRLFTGGA